MIPPRLATWLLLTLGVGSDLESIAGDLAEQYPSRSTAWYWRQVVYTVLVNVTQHLRHHWILALRAIYVGGLVMGLAGVTGRYLAYWILPAVLPAPINPSSWPVLLLTIGAPAVITGCVLARLHRPHGFPFALAFAVVAPVALLPRLFFLVRNSQEHERFLPYLYSYVGSTMPRVATLIVLGVLTGAILVQARRTSSALRQI
jgi:hypothetical protein